jgi:hypothetical protein
MNPNCPICRGIGSVCENYPEKPWDPGCGAGVPRKCNETDGVDEPDVSQVIGEEEPKRHCGCSILRGPPRAPIGSSTTACDLALGVLHPYVLSSFGEHGGSTTGAHAHGETFHRWI